MHKVSSRVFEYIEAQPGDKELSINNSKPMPHGQKICWLYDAF